MNGRIYRRGFSLLELVAVIASIAILAAIVLPTLGKVKRSVTAKQVKIQYQRYVQAIAANYREYGAYPPWLSTTELVNLYDCVDQFCATINGKDVSGLNCVEDTSLRSYNPYAISFLELTDDDFGIIASEGGDRQYITNRFKQTDIFIIVSEHGHSISPEIFNSYPSIKDLVPASGLRERVAIFSVGNNKDTLDVVSWRTE